MTLSHEETKSARDMLLARIREHAVLDGSKHFLASNHGSPLAWLVDIRRISLQGSFLEAFAELFWEQYADRPPFQVGGIEAAAIPLITSIVMSSLNRGRPVNGFIVRKERKTHGTANLLEGELNDLPIVILDDLLNSGASLEKVRVVLDQYGREIDSVFTLVDFQSPAGLHWRERRNVAIKSIYTLDELGLSQKPNHKPTLATFHDLWSFAAPTPNLAQRVPKSFPVTDGQRLYFGSDAGIFWCLNASDASVLWSFRVTSPGHKNIWSSAALHQGHVFFGAYDGNVYCLNALNGSEIWRFEDADWVGSSPALAPDLGLLFIGLEFATKGQQGSLVALDLSSGKRVWEHRTRRFTHASPAYWPDRNLVACGSNDNEMFLFDAATGTVRWRFETSSGSGKGSIRHAPAFDPSRGQLVTGCANGFIYVIDIATGREVWSVQTDNTIYTVPLVLGDFAYVGSTDKFMYVLDLEQQTIKTRFYVGSKIYGPARLLLGRIYFGACNGIVYEIDPFTHDITGQHQLPDAITNALVCDPDTRTLYAISYANQLFAFVRDDYTSTDRRNQIGE